MGVTVGQLEALLALAEHGGFTSAARSLGLTQSAVSRAIATLERELGAPVVHRGPDGARLTTLGVQVARRADTVTAQLHAIDQLAGHIRTPRLRIGAVTSALVRLIPDAVSALRRDWPRSEVLTVRGEDDELADWLADRTVDVVVGTSRGAAPPRRELDDEFLAVLPRNHRLARAERVGLAELVAAGVADPGGTCGPLLAEGFAAHGVLWQPAHVVRDVDTVLAMAAAGITAGVAPALAAPHPPPAGVVLLPLDPPLRRTLYVHHDPRDADAATFAGLLDR